MKNIIYKHGNLILDDYEINEFNEGNDYWTQLCDEHAGKVTEKMQLDDCGSGVCGVKDCWKASDHYLDFNHGDYYTIGETI